MECMDISVSDTWCDKGLQIWAAQSWWLGIKWATLCQGSLLCRSLPLYLICEGRLAAVGGNCEFHTLALWACRLIKTDFLSYTIEKYCCWSLLILFRHRMMHHTGLFSVTSMKTWFSGWWNSHLKIIFSFRTHVATMCCTSCGSLMRCLFVNLAVGSWYDQPTFGFSFLSCSWFLN